MNTPLEPISVAGATVAARFEAAVYAWRNLLAGLPLGFAWLAMQSPAGRPALAGATLLIGLGAALRAWGTLHNRYAQGERKALATSGPYAWLRNPLYVANSLVLLGGVVASGLFVLLPATALWCGLVYNATVRHEEQRLREKYGRAYSAYCARVGRWLPHRPGAWPRERPGRFLAAFALQSRVFLVLAPFLLHGAF